MLQQGAGPAHFLGKKTAGGLSAWLVYRFLGPCRGASSIWMRHGSLSPGGRAADTCRTDWMMKAPQWYDVLEPQVAVITVGSAKERINVHAAEPAIRYQDAP